MKENKMEQLERRIAELETQIKGREVHVDTSDDARLSRDDIRWMIAQLSVD